MYNPEEDGITHINIYSQGKTELGRALSNWAPYPIQIGHDMFNNIECYWFFLASGNCLFLKPLTGYEAKALAKKMHLENYPRDPLFKPKILEALAIKLRTYPELHQELIENKLPLVHYYVFGSKVIVPDKGTWVVEFFKLMSLP